MINRLMSSSRSLATSATTTKKGKALNTMLKAAAAALATSVGKATSIME